MLAEAQQFELLNKAWCCFQKTFSSYYQIGPFTLCLVFANEGWAKRITRSYHHLAVSRTDSPDFTVCLWDSATSGNKLPELDWDLITQNGYKGYFNSPFYFHYFESINALSAIHTAKNLAYFIARDCQTLPWWIDASPLQVILHVFLRERGLQLTHTGAVCDEFGAILLCGKGGSGKSTTVLSCLTSGLHYLGEDYCILEPGNTPCVYSIYQSAKWEKHTLGLFSHYKQFVQNPVAAQTEKALVYYKDIFPGQIKKQMPIRAVVSLKVGAQGAPDLKNDSKESVLKNLMMSTLNQLPFYHHQTMFLLKELVAKLPAYHLTLGSDLTSNAIVIKKLLSGEAR